jgi:Zn-finger nucleic acid-binding protein
MTLLDAGLVANAFVHANRANAQTHMDHPPGEEKEGLSPEERRMLESIQAQISSSAHRFSVKRCPECRNYLSLLKLDNVELDVCCACQGIWFDLGELQHFTGFTRDVPAEHLYSRISKYSCPVCGEIMQEHVFIRSYNLLADQCLAGHGVYLEKGELERAFGIT